MKHISILLLFVASICSAQPPDTVWTQTFGGNHRDFGFAVAESNDGGYVLCGRLQSYLPWEDRDVYLVKLNDAGDSVWTKRYGSPDIWEEGWDIAATHDGGYIVAGFIGLENVSTDIYLLKLDGLGNLEWERTYGGPDVEEANAVKQTPDGGYVVVGRTESYGAGLSDSYIIRTDEVGDTLWTKTYGGVFHEVGRDVVVLADSGFAVASSNTSDGPGATAVELRQLDENGASIWDRRYGGYNLDTPRCLIRCLPSGYLIGGTTLSFAPTTKTEAFMIRVSGEGDSLWMRTYGYRDSSEIFYSVAQLPDDGFILTGSTGSTSEGADLASIYLVRTDSLGDLEWSSIHGGFDHQSAEAVLVTSDNGLLVCGWTGEWWGMNDVDLYAMRFESILDFTPTRNRPFPSQLTLRAYPNPFNAETTLAFYLNRPQMIELTLYDQLGRVVRTLINEQAPAGEITYHLTASSLPSGTYYARLTTPSSQFTRKLVLLK